jgi:hypothetical protein
MLPPRSARTGNGRSDTGTGTVCGSAAATLSSANAMTVGKGAGANTRLLGAALKGTGGATFGMAAGGRGGAAAS